MAEVCSNGQGDGDHVCADGLDSTSVGTSWYLGLFDTLPAWGLRCLGCECWTVRIPCDCASDDIEEEWSATYTVDCLLSLVLKKELMGPQR